MSMFSHFSSFASSADFHSSASGYRLACVVVAGAGLPIVTFVLVGWVAESARLESCGVAGDTIWVEVVGTGNGVGSRVR